MNHTVRYNKVSSFFISIIYLLILFSVYFLNNSPTDQSILYTKLFNLAVSALVLFMLLYGAVFLELKSKVIDFFVIANLLVVVIATYLTRGYVNFHWIYLFFAYFYFKNNNSIHINRTFNVVVLLAAFFASLFWMYNTRFYDGRPVTNWFDPNYSGFYVFVLFLLLWYSNLKFFSLIILFSGFLLLSRSYYLSVLIFFLLVNINLFREVFFKFKLNHFLVMVFIGLCFLIPIEKYFTSHESRLASMSDKSVLVVADASNQDRFTANVLFKEDLLESFLDYQFGMDVEEYTDRVFRNTPHNAFYALIINYGVYFTFFYLILYARAYDRFFTKENFPIIMCLFPYYLLLGAGIQGFPGLLVFFLLAIDKKEV